jgi:hypothetical protein
MQHELLALHRDLWRDHEDGFATLNIQNGAVDVSSVVANAFGLRLDFDPAIFIPLDQWDPASLNA